MYSHIVTGLTLLTSFLMLVALLRPLTMLRLYLICRPLITPFAFWQYVLFGNIPIGTPHLAIFTLGGFLSSFGPEKKICPSGLLMMYAYLFFSLPSLLLAPSLMSSVTVLAKATAGMAAFLISYNYVRSYKNITHFLLTIVLFSAIIPLGYGVYQYVTGTSNIFMPYWPAQRITSVFATSNAFGEYLNIVILLLLAMLISPYYKKQRKWLLIILAIAGVESLLSQNRGAWIGLILGILGSMMIYRRVFPIKWLILGGLAVALLGGAFIMSRFEMLSTVSEWGHSRDTFGGRLGYMSDLLSIAFEQPFFGQGLGYVYDKLPMVPHNDYLWIFIESGLLAAMCYLFFMIWNILKHVSNRHTAYWRWIQFAFCAINIYFFIHSWMQNIFNNPSTFPFFMACMGCAAKLMTLPEEPRG